MSIAKPFTFVANTFAKASEVNADFDTVYSQVNTNISNIAQNATDIDNLENNKADLNGNAAQRFAVANPSGNSDAINKQYLMASISNVLDYISGLVITKDGPNTILVSAGSCYDKDDTVILKLNNQISKTNSTQSANSTYYVYITSANASGVPTDIVISQSSTTPGTTKYRQIGYYTTDGDGNIAFIYSYGDDTTKAKASSVITTTYVNGSSWYRIYSDGWCEQGGIYDNGSAAGNFKATITFLKPFIDTNYTAQAITITTNEHPASSSIYAYSSSDMSIFVNRNYNSSANMRYIMWQACGYIS